MLLVLLWISADGIWVMSVVGALITGEFRPYIKHTDGGPCSCWSTKGQLTRMNRHVGWTRIHADRGIGIVLLLLLVFSYLYICIIIILLVSGTIVELVDWLRPGRGLLLLLWRVLLGEAVTVRLMSCSLV